MQTPRKTGIGAALAALLFILALAGPTQAMDVFLRADVFTKTMHDGSVVPMWGFARDSAFGAMDGVVTAPGPAIVIPPGDGTLNIYLDNNLTAAATGFADGAPVSIVIPSLKQALSPARGTVAPYEGRIRSFNYETAPGNAAPVVYTWTNVTPGTHVYYSGAHPQVTVQMGLYGAVTRNFAAGQPYQGVNAGKEVLVFYSEIDPLLHAAVAANDYGPGKTMTSTVHYEPKYFLLNGNDAVNVASIQAAGPETILVRFVNAGLLYKCPNIQEVTMSEVAEAGFLKTWPESCWSLIVEPLITHDALVTATAAGPVNIFDRRGYKSLLAADAALVLTPTVN